jgi:3-methyladenine DNA glycosylase/8-oxoguanine DNA glycosylase
MTTLIQIPLVGPAGEPADLRRILVSQGFAELSPMRLDESGPALEATLPLHRARPRRVRMEAGRPGHVGITVLGPVPGPRLAAQVERAARHVLRLDADLSVFYLKASADPDLAWAATGAGRILRSPTVFEDVIKTLCTTNCSWGLTRKMVDALVTELGEPAIGGSGDPLTNAFPTPEAISGQPPAFYREVVKAGYRAPHFPAIGKLVASGELPLEAMATDHETDDETLEELLLGLPGIGPYAAAHIMMTLGRYPRLVLDSWTRPKYAKLAGKRRQPSDTQIRRRFAKYGDHAGLAFWLYVTRDWVPELAEA